MLACDWLLWVRWRRGGAELRKQPDAEATWQDLYMTGEGQSSPSSLAGINQSEDAALETWNRLNKMKWTKERNMDLEGRKKRKMNEMWRGEKGGKWRMEDGKETQSAENYKLNCLAIKWFQQLSAQTAFQDSILRFCTIKANWIRTMASFTTSKVQQNLTVKKKSIYNCKS